MSPPPPPPPPPPGPPPNGPSSQLNSSCFFGFLLATLSFGALIMLYVQLAQVLLLHPSRDRTFWSIVVYSFGLVPLLLSSFVGQASYAGITFTAGGFGSSFDQATSWCNNLNHISGAIIPCVADLLMFYRVIVLWGRQRKILIPLGLLYLLRTGISVPDVMAWTTQPSMSTRSDYLFAVALSALSFALNASFTGLICFRLFSMRHKAERVLGRLQATLYNSKTTVFVESGAFFTIWTFVYLVTVMSPWVQAALSDPSQYVVILTRMLIIQRMAQNRAWTAEIINASEEGVLEWGVNSTPSIELNFQSTDK